jgi:hypothetical protein
MSIFTIVLLVLACGKANEESISLLREQAKKMVPLTEFLQEIKISNMPKKIKSNENIILPVTVKNISKETWPKNSVHLVYFWKDKTGEMMLGKTEGTGYMKTELGPGELTSLDLNIIAPDKSGSYVLIFTMVQEEVAFFNKKGAKTLDIPITVN